MEYGREAMGFDEDFLPHFWRIVKALDSVFLDWMKIQHDRHIRRSKPGKGSAKNSVGTPQYGR